MNPVNIMNNFVATTRTVQKSSLELIDSSLPDYIGIYGVASLSKLTQLLPYKPNTEFTQIKSFLVDGELRGCFKCFYNNEGISESLITESFNILLGRLLTNLEEKNLLCALSAPSTKDYNFLAKENKVSFKYLLEDAQKKLPLQINFYYDEKILEA